MSQATDGKPSTSKTDGKPSTSKTDGRPNNTGRSNRNNSRSRQRWKPEEIPWVPNTKLGKDVASGKVTSLEEIFTNGWKIKEAEIVSKIMSDLESTVVGVSVVQKQTDAGESTKFKAVVAVGISGWFGIGTGKTPMMRNSIEKATNNAKMNIIPVKLGCGSWECRCNGAHSVPYNIIGKSGSVRIELIPAPKGLGIVAGESIKKLIGLTGIKDVWTSSKGSTSTTESVANAVYDALKKVHGVNITK